MDVNTHGNDLELKNNIIKLYVDGITCHSCESVIRHSLRDVEGIEKIEVLV